ncbi:MAG: molecular chaperone SurA [Halobacteria archaeon]|nr:molecular chaperone SurA [Halobacteria archaeon]
MKYHRLLSLVFLLSAAGTCIAAEHKSGSPTSLNHIVAIVNDGIIVSSQLESAIEEIRKQLQDKDTAVPPRNVLQSQVLERLVVEKLQLQIAERSGSTIDDSMLNDKVRELASDNGMTLTDFRAVIERDGYDYTSFREDLRKQMLIQQIRRQMISSRIKVNEQEVDNLLATLKASGKGDVEYHLAHILVAIPDAASPEQIEAAEQRALDLHARLRGGGGFAELAIAESDGQTALEGGDIGWRSIGQMPGLFVEPVKQMEVGDISDLIRSPGGFHIIKLVEKRGDERHIMRQTRVRHILLKPDLVQSDEENLARIRQLEIRLRAGEDFANLARANSQDTLSASRDGDLGWLSSGDTVPLFEEAMDALSPGEISAPVKTRFGWHLIQVQEYRDHDNTEEFERNKARNLIRSRKYDEELFLWLRRLRDEAYVEYRIEGT